MPCRLADSVDETVGTAARVDVLHRFGDLVGVGGPVLQQAYARIEANNRRLALVADHQGIDQVPDLAHLRDDSLHMGVNLQTDHQRDRLIGDVHLNVLFFAVIVQMELEWLETVDVIVVASKTSTGAVTSSTDSRKTRHLRTFCLGRLRLWEEGRAVAARAGLAAGSERKEPSGQTEVSGMFSAASQQFQHVRYQLHDSIQGFDGSFRGPW